MNVIFPEIFKGLFKPSRYLVYYGGRGSGKSWQIARFLILQAYAKNNIRILCTREIQRSIADSVHKLISDQIDLLELTPYFEVQNNYIKCIKTGSLFLFEGLAHNITKIKSMEGISYCWVEEAEKITEKSWDILIPTIRAKGSEIIVSFNPERDDDATYKMFIINRMENAIVQQVNWTENKHFPDVLKKEMETCKKINYSKYLHIWEGEPITDYDTLIYRFDRKINEVDYDIPYARGIETISGWDFGVSDDTAIIIMQIHQMPKSDEFPLGIKITIVDEYIKNNEKAEHYRKVIDKKKYIIHNHYCDPSGASRDSSLSSWIYKIGYNFDYTYSYSPAEMIDCSNDMIHAVRINRYQTPLVYKMFMHWQYKTDKDGVKKTPATPNHDEFSHPGTAFYFAMINRFPPTKKGGRVRIG